MTIVATELETVLDPAALAAHLSEGEIRVQTHPASDDYAIYNYAERVQFARNWTRETLACRGLIVHLPTGRVLARPFTKFFNLSELTDEQVEPLKTERVEVWEKLDGSLGILYPGPDGWAIATRGSFASEQAKHATELLRTRYASYTPPPGVTVLFEIIYPDNRIVLDYAGLDDLVLLGGIDTATGRTVPFDVATFDWTGPIVERHPFRNLAEALAAPQRHDREGYVIRFTESDVRVKVKHEEYVRLHRIVTGLNERSVWEALVSEHGPLSGRLDGVPDEFHTWVVAVETRIASEIADLLDDAYSAFEWIKTTLGETFERRDFAGEAGKHGSLRPYLFLLLDGNHDKAKTLAHRSVKPAGGAQFAPGLDA